MDFCTNIGLINIGFNITCDIFITYYTQENIMNKGEFITYISEKHSTSTVFHITKAGSRAHQNQN